MSWTPIAKPGNGRPLASASLRKNKSGEISINLFLSQFLADAIGNPDEVTVEAGDGEHAGQVRITPGDAYKLGKGVGGSRRVIVPCPASLDISPTAPAGTFPCTLVTDKGAQIILALPVKSWWTKPTPAPAALVRVPQNHEPRPAPAHLVGSEPVALDVVQYLGAKGVKVQRLAESRYLLDGVRVGLAEVLGVVNAHRAKANLSPITADKP